MARPARRQGQAGSTAEDASTQKSSNYKHPCRWVSPLIAATTPHKLRESPESMADFVGIRMLSSFYRGALPELRRRSIGPDPVFGRLWQETGCRAVLRRLLADRDFGVDVE